MKNSIEAQIRIVRHSILFDRRWYQEQYPDVKSSGMEPARHYFLYGWKEGRDPSARFVTEEYLTMNKDVRAAKICPLYHYEKFGRWEGRPYRLDSSREMVPTAREYIILSMRWLQRAARGYPEKCRYQKIPIQPQKILFATYQYAYACNPKYICEELLKRELPCEIVWLYKGDAKVRAQFPKQVKCVLAGTEEARREIASARILIENGCLLFTDTLIKKKGQINICTWHGSMGFKRIGMETFHTKSEKRIAGMYQKIHDILLTNSRFEEEVFRSSFWPNSVFWKLGHPRNDILFCTEPEEISRIKEKVRRKLKIPNGYRFALYAPTFRVNPTAEGRRRSGAQLFEEKDCYRLDYKLVKGALKKRFGGEWTILVRHHYCNAANKFLQSGMMTESVPATDYDDMQELMVASDVGITDYSSWMLDYLLSGKPGFLFAADVDIYAAERGFYYPLSTTPFPLAVNTEQLCAQIEAFDTQEYKENAEIFLEEKGYVEDGNASRYTVDRLAAILEGRS